MKNWPIPRWLTALLAVMLLIIAVATPAGMRENKRQADLRQQLKEYLDGIADQEDPLGDLVARLEDLEARDDRQAELLEQILEQLEALAFHPSAEIPLAPALQEHAYTVSGEHGVRYEVVLAVMYGESGFDESVRDNVNRDGSRDRGLMQINECNWNWLQEDHSLDVNDPADNIEAGILILAMLQEQHGTEELALVAYECGSGRMAARGLTTTENSRRVLRRADEFSQIHGGAEQI